MKNIKCTIIQDILPLYVDEVVSEDTKEMVDEHLQHCTTCQQEYTLMKQDLFIPVEVQDPILHKMSKKWRTKKVKIALASIVGTAIMLFGIFVVVMYVETVIPYSEELIQIEEQADGQLVSRYYGESYGKIALTHPEPIEIDGEVKNISFLYYTKTIGNSPTRNLFNNNTGGSELGYTFEIPDSEEVDAVYYAEYDALNPGTILEHAELIWERK